MPLFRGAPAVCTFTRRLSNVAMPLLQVFQLPDEVPAIGCQPQQACVICRRPDGRKPCTSFPELARCCPYLMPYLPLLAM